MPDCLEALTSMPALSDFDLPELESRLTEWDCKPSQAGKILRAYYNGSGAIDLNSLDLGKSLLHHLANIPPMQTKIVHEHLSNDGTVKLLLGMTDGQAVESVLMPAFRPDRAAGCISSQIGCAMGCDFCASARGGLARNLSAGEIVEQFLHLSRRAQSLGRRLSSLVFMGMGEPMHNLANVMKAIDRIARPDLGNLGWKHITVSTVGIIPGIEALAQSANPPYLALSLHAPDDATRSRLVPTNRKWGVADVMAASRAYQEKTGRILNIEYCLIRDVNDSDEQANQLASLMENFPAHVNIIPHNWIGSGISGIEYRKPSPERIDRFVNILRDRNVVTHIRVTRGDDVAAACGQLRERSSVLQVLSPSV